MTSECANCGEAIKDGDEVDVGEVLEILVHFDCKGEYLICKAEERADARRDRALDNKQRL